DIDQLPPGNTLHQGLRAAGLDLRVGAIVQARIHVGAEEDRIVGATAVADTRVGGRGIAALEVTVVAHGARVVDVEEGTVQAAAGERVDRHREALAARRAGIGRVRETRGADQGQALEEIRHHHAFAAGRTALGPRGLAQRDVPTSGTGGAGR